MQAHDSPVWRIIGEHHWFRCLDYKAAVAVEVGRATNDMGFRGKPLGSLPSVQLLQKP